MYVIVLFACCRELLAEKQNRPVCYGPGKETAQKTVDEEKKQALTEKERLDKQKSELDKLPEIYKELNELRKIKEQFD